MRVLPNKAERGDSEIGLMRLVAAHDRRAQRVLAHRLAPRVKRLTLRLLADAADADDAAQQSLLEILSSAGSYREIASIERWADRITVRTALRLARERRRRQSVFGQLVDLEGLRAPKQARPAEGIARGIDEYLEQIPHARREVLVLKHALGYTTEEISELVSAPVGTVKDRLVAGRKQLRRLIQRERRLGAARSLE